ncbi:unnamed protein product [Haemonchus placei]|uniref:Ubiquitin-like domain-containing protein n=1 Tax=Haemonchus placei TaxID=6290 RepID=A0A0N4W9S9_HAEPC|nr:unnamed protein product [Haemonchus placei]
MHTVFPFLCFTEGFFCFQVTLRLILVSGRTHEFQFHPLTPAHEVTQKVFEQWPKEWAEEKVESASMLKLIYHGRFLHGSVTLNALNLPQGKTTVMHLVTRENLPEPNSNGWFVSCACICG